MASNQFHSRYGPYMSSLPWQKWLRERWEEIARVSGPMRPGETGRGILCERLGVDYDLLQIWYHAKRKRIGMYRAEDALWSYFHATGQLYELTDIWPQCEVDEALAIALAKDIKKGKRRQIMKIEEAKEIIRRSQHGN